MSRSTQMRTKGKGGKSKKIPRNIDFGHVHSIFQKQYHSIENQDRDALYKGNSMQTLRFLLNEYTRSRLIHYDKLNSFLLGIPSIAEILRDANQEGSLTNLLCDEERTRDFEVRKNELFSPVVAQSALFLINKLLKRPFKWTHTSNEHFPPIRNLLHVFVGKVDPQKKQNFDLYYDKSDLKTISIFLEKNPNLDITQVFPLFFENDEFVFYYEEWLEKLQGEAQIYDARQEVMDDFTAKKQNLKILNEFLRVYLRDVKIPADIDKIICEFLPKILHLDLIREIIAFYEKFLPKCFPEGGKLQKIVGAGISAFKCILEKTYGQNFITMGYYEFYNLLKRSSVPPELIDSWILDLDDEKSRLIGYDRFWKKPFFKFKRTGKNKKTEVAFSYVQVLDAFFYFLSTKMKSYVMASTRGRGFEEIVAEKIIKELGIIPQKIVVFDRNHVQNDPKFIEVKKQNKLETPSGQIIPPCMFHVDSEYLKLGKNFRWREIDLAFVYKKVLYILECKNHLLCNFADFEPILFRRNIDTLKSMYEKRTVCEDSGVKKSLNMTGGMQYEKVRFIIVSGEECPFNFMLSYQQFGKFLNDFDAIHTRLEEMNLKYLPKTVYTGDEFIIWSQGKATNHNRKKNESIE